VTRSLLTDAAALLFLTTLGALVLAWSL